MDEEAPFDADRG